MHRSSLILILALMLTSTTPTVCATTDDTQQADADPSPTASDAAVEAERVTIICGRPVLLPLRRTAQMLANRGNYTDAAALVDQIAVIDPDTGAAARFDLYAPFTLWATCLASALGLLLYRPRFWRKAGR